MALCERQAAPARYLRGRHHACHCLLYFLQLSIQLPFPGGCGRWDRRCLCLRLCVLQTLLPPRIPCADWISWGLLYMNVCYCFRLRRCGLRNQHKAGPSHSARAPSIAQTVPSRSHAPQASTDRTQLPQVCYTALAAVPKPCWLQRAAAGETQES